MEKIYKKNSIRIGILGGTFDPPHAGHLHISKIAIKKLNLDKLIWVITKQNPFKKQPSLSIGKRIKLAKQKVKKQKKIFILYIEKKIKSKNTFDLLSYLKKKKQKKYFFFFNWG